MEHDLNCVRYDLALSYAREKLRYALEHGIPERIYPDKDLHLDELEYLEQQFVVALKRFSGIGEDEDLVDTLKDRKSVV